MGFFFFVMDAYNIHTLTAVFRYAYDALMYVVDC